MANSVIAMLRKKYFDELTIKLIDEAISYSMAKPKPVVTIEETLARKEKEDKKKKTEEKKKE